MAKAKKTKKVKIEDQSEQLQELGEIKISQKRYEECEWCYQFDNDEPKIFAWTDSDIKTDEAPTVTFTVSNVENAYISFSHNGKTFKLFARELTDEGKKMREYQKKTAEDFKKDLENFDQKMEEYGSENKEA